MYPAARQVPDMSAGALREADQVYRQDPSRPARQISPRASQTGGHGRSLTRAEIRTLEPGPAEPAGPPGGSSAATTPGTRAHLGYSSDVVEVVETYLCRPLVRPLMMVVRAARRLQSGRPDAYLAYMLIALIAAIAVVVALA
jgi:hypothetical protein